MIEAVPPDRLTVPRTVAPSLNVIFPVAVDGVTVAVKVTEAPKVDGLRSDPTIAVVVALFTVWVMADDVDPVKFVSPP
jgi:hypothetical protein